MNEIRSIERLTHERKNGIKTGYWSPSTKQELANRLGAYEDTGLTPEQIREMDRMYAERCKELSNSQKHGGFVGCIECEYRAYEKTTGIHWCRLCNGLDGYLKSGDGCTRGKRKEGE